jgi:soluble lytic murein transglycosylase
LDHPSPAAGLRAGPDRAGRRRATDRRRWLGYGRARGIGQEGREPIVRSAEGCLGGEPSTGGLGGLLGAQQPPGRLPSRLELDAFYARWPGTYVEDRLRNDWLLELGRRRDWANLVSAEYPRFRMNDDREVTCYALLTQHQAGQDVRAPRWRPGSRRRDLDDGCALLAGTLAEAKLMRPKTSGTRSACRWKNNRPRAARAAAALLGPATDKGVAEALDNPTRYLARLPRHVQGAADQQLQLLALMRLAANEPDYAAAQLQGGWAQRLAARPWLPPPGPMWAARPRSSSCHWPPCTRARPGRRWDGASPLRNACGPALERRPAGLASARRAAPARQRSATLASGAARHGRHERQPNSATPAWVYWRARATMALAKPGAEGDAARAAGRRRCGTLPPSSASTASWPPKNWAAAPPACRPHPPPLSAAERQRAAPAAGLCACTAAHRSGPAQ